MGRMKVAVYFSRGYQNCVHWVIVHEVIRMPQFSLLFSLLTCLRDHIVFGGHDGLKN